MKPPHLRPAIAALIALALTLVTVPSVLAAGGPGAPADDPTPVVDPTSTPDATPAPVENGEIVIDPTFITSSPTLDGEVAGVTGRPKVTPPPTDTIQAATAPGASLQVLLVLGVAGPILALAVARVPTRRRH